MFLQTCVILCTGRGIVPYPLQGCTPFQFHTPARPYPLQDHTLSRVVSPPALSPSRAIPPAPPGPYPQDHAPPYRAVPHPGTSKAGGTHPTGMHSFSNVLFCCTYDCLSGDLDVDSRGSHPLGRAVWKVKHPFHKNHQEDDSVGVNEYDPD